MLRCEIELAATEYLKRFPEDAMAISPLTYLLDSDADITSRKEFRGHVTCCGIVMDDAGQFLMIRHRILKSWLLPGGHLEDTDAELRAAAIREVNEETGLSREALRGFGGWFDKVPVQIDCHSIPANPVKDEPAHRHMDFRYLFRCEASNISPQLEEVTDCAWLDASRLPVEAHGRLRQLAIF